MAKVDLAWDLAVGHLGQRVKTPGGEGTIAGYVDRNGATLVLVDLGERNAGGVISLSAFAGEEISLANEEGRSGASPLRLEAAAAIAREPAR